MRKAILSLSGLVMSAALFAAPAEPAQNNNKPTGPVIITKSKKGNKTSCMPGMPIQGSYIMDNGFLTLSLPIETGNLEVVIESASDEAVISSGTFADPSQITLPFECTEGDYNITLESETSLYRGYFSITF